MGEVRYTKDGLLIPTEQTKTLGKDVRVQEANGVLIIESKQHETARKQLAGMVKRLRQSAQDTGPIDSADSDALVDEVREMRAGHY